MRNTTRRHLAAVPARPVRRVEEFVLVVHRPFKSWCYYPEHEGQPAWTEESEVQPGTYPVRAVHIDGHSSAVVDLDVVITRTEVRRRGIFPRRVERPYTHTVSDRAWHPDDVADGVAALTDDGAPLATWRRISGAEADRG